MIGRVIPTGKGISSNPTFLESLYCIVCISNITELPAGKFNVKFYAFLNHSIRTVGIEDFNIVVSYSTISFKRRPFLNTSHSNFRCKTLKEDVSRIILCFLLSIFDFASKVGIVNMCFFAVAIFIRYFINIRRRGHSELRVCTFSKCRRFMRFTKKLRHILVCKLFECQIFVRISNAHNILRRIALIAFRLSTKYENCCYLSCGTISNNTVIDIIFIDGYCSRRNHIGIANSTINAGLIHNEWTSVRCKEIKAKVSSRESVFITYARLIFITCCAATILAYAFDADRNVLFACGRATFIRTLDGFFV